jgi:hypothetical protein
MMLVGARRLWGDDCAISAASPLFPFFRGVAHSFESGQESSVISHISRKSPEIWGTRVIFLNWSPGGICAKKSDKRYKSPSGLIFVGGRS